MEAGDVQGRTKHLWRSLVIDGNKAMKRLTFRFRGRLQAGMIALLTTFFAMNLDAAAIKSANVVATQNLREAWLNQNMARNQQFWAKMAGNQGGINAASVGKGPNSLHQVWNTFNKRMRFASQLKPASATGYLPNTPFVNDLWSRRAINAARFAQYHGTIAQVMDWDTYFKTHPVSPKITPAVTPSVRPSQQIVIPEPTTILSGLIMTGFGTWFMRRNKSKTVA